MNILDPITGTIQVGVQKRFNARIAASFDYGLKFNKLSFSGEKSERKNYKYHKYKVELKYFFKVKTSDHSQINKPYLSVQGFYLPQQYRKDNSWLQINGKSYHYDYSNIDRNVVATSILMGNEQIIGRLVLDYYFGLGVRKLTIKHQPTNTVEGNRPEAREWSHTPIDFYEGNFYRPHVANGFKIGYILNR